MYTKVFIYPFLLFVFGLLNCNGQVDTVRIHVVITESLDTKTVIDSFLADSVNMNSHNLLVFTDGNSNEVIDDKEKLLTLVERLKSYIPSDPMIRETAVFINSYINKLKSEYSSVFVELVVYTSSGIMNTYDIDKQLIQRIKVINNLIEHGPEKDVRFLINQVTESTK